MPRRKHVQEHTEVTAWPSSFPEDIGENEPHGSGESLDSDELGSHFMTDVVEHVRSGHEVWEGEPDEEPFDAPKPPPSCAALDSSRCPSGTAHGHPPTRPRSPSTSPSCRSARASRFDELSGRDGRREPHRADDSRRLVARSRRRGTRRGQVAQPQHGRRTHPRQAARGATQQHAPAQAQVRGRDSPSGKKPRPPKTSTKDEHDGQHEGRAEEVLERRAGDASRFSPTWTTSTSNTLPSLPSRRIGAVAEHRLVRLRELARTLPASRGPKQYAVYRHRGRGRPRPRES